jgi:hypothetical protein
MMGLQSCRLPHDQGDENGKAARAGWRHRRLCALSEIPAAVDAVVGEMVPLVCRVVRASPSVSCIRPSVSYIRWFAH